MSGRLLLNLKVLKTINPIPIFYLYIKFENVSINEKAMVGYWALSDQGQGQHRPSKCF